MVTRAAVPPGISRFHSALWVIRTPFPEAVESVARASGRGIRVRSITRNIKPERAFFHVRIGNSS